MNIFDINESLHREIEPVTIHTTPVNQDVNFQKTALELNSKSGGPPALNKTGKSIPWRKIIITGSVIVLVVFLIKEYKKNQKNKSSSEKNRERPER